MRATMFSSICTSIVGVGVGVVGLGLAGSASLAHAETPPAGTPTTPSTTTTSTSSTEELEARIKALEDQAEDAQDEREDLTSELADLKDRVAASKLPTSLNAMNPQITAFLNGIGRFDDKPVFTPAGERVDDRLFMRTLEVEFRAAVDPFADAVAILSLEDEVGNGYGVDLEEGYAVVKKLPILDAAPLGLKLKLGRFRAPFGTINRVHMHDLPWTSRPLAISRLLGNEHGELFEGGFNAVGADAEVILPEIIPGVVMELNGDVVDGGDIAISGAAEGDHRHLGYLGHYNLFVTVADAHDFNLGASVYAERGPHAARLYGLDALYKWKPIAAGEFHSVVLGGEVMVGDRRFAQDTDGDGLGDAEARAKPLAWYAFGQVQLNWHTYLGARYDLAQDLVDTTKTTRVAAGYLSYYTSEFLRFRVGYEHRWSDVPTDDNINSAIAEVNVVFGSHPTEPYWVNR